MLKTEKKASQMKLEHDKKEYMRNYYHKNVLNHLINSVKELKNITVNK